MSTRPSAIPNPAVRRLSLYLRELEALATRDVPTVSSQKLALPLGLTAAQVRKDLALFGQFGRSGVGYEVNPLIHRLKHILGTDRVTNTLLVGVGNIGRALATYPGFAPKGFHLVALFDSDARKIGRKIGEMAIEPMSQLKAVIERQSIRLAIVAVPDDAAQGVADQLVEAGIAGILNFAPAQLRVPERVAVRHIRLAAELEMLNFLTAAHG